MVPEADEEKRTAKVGGLVSIWRFGEPVLPAPRHMEGAQHGDGGSMPITRWIATLSPGRWKR